MSRFDPEHYPVRRPGEAYEAALLADVADGDPEAFRTLWELYGTPVYRLCLTITGEAAIADDAVQETFLRIWRRAGGYDASRGAPAAWVMTVARNTARTIARSGPVALPATEAAGDDRTDAIVDRVCINRALGRLSPAERLAIELAYFADLSHSQVAARLGEPLGTVKARIRRALLRLADHVGEA